MEMLLLLEVHTEKQESKITGCNQGDTNWLYGESFWWWERCPAGTGDKRGLGVFICGDIQNSAGQGPELPALNFKHYFKVSVSLSRRLK